MLERIGSIRRGALGPSNQFNPTASSLLPTHPDRQRVSSSARRQSAHMNLLVNLDVDDLDKAVRFYGSVFGLKVGRRFGASGVEMLGSSAPIYLLAKAPRTLASRSISQRRNYERHWTPVHIDFVVEEIETAVEIAIAAGAQLEEPVATHKWGKLALMADPFGHGFCFVQFLGQGYDEIASNV
jgi:predicted enzyme related to lactoylglutathione lyase